MKSDKGKVVILIFILVMLYAVVYYRFIWMDRFSPQLEDLSTDIETEQMTKNALERDLADIDTLKREVNMKTVQDERLSEFLMSEASLADSFDYVDRLNKMFNNQLTDANVNPPRQRTSDNTDTTYYEFGVGFSAELSLGEVLNLIDFLEGGTRKVRVSAFDIRPISERASVVVEESEEEEEEYDIYREIYSIEVAVNFHSLDEGHIDKMYDYSRQRFNRFEDGDGFSVSFDEPLSPIFTIADEDTSYTGGGSTDAAPAFRRDVVVELMNFYVGGPNFITRCANTRKRIGIKTGDFVELSLSFDASTYRAHSKTPHREVTYDGEILGDTINIEINADFPLNVPENENFRTDITIVNNSGKQIRIKNNDEVRRVSLMDRNGNQIYRRSEVENLIVI
ncbi:hypothetical protein RBH29_05235 [Herbivorax sp. ANBcel31]|uniref:hypothetical protein n=1 Tax=Herbivorax sp. ANBcel31 TaxID=3069754 RepID=UPI0027AE9872|nr:hypothetical protein [Herbivorax sp. ANBcel31]MDQ2085839.1 hypothetical protein [Herbivorax sp. ANBcel31]